MSETMPQPGGSTRGSSGSGVERAAEPRDGRRPAFPVIDFGAQANPRRIQSVEFTPRHSDAAQ